MVAATLLGGLRRCEVLSLRLEDLRPAERRVFIAEGTGSHQRIVPISSRFFTTVPEYLEIERPRTSAERMFVVLKGPQRGQQLTAAGLDEIVADARKRPGVARLTTAHVDEGFGVVALGHTKVPGLSRRLLLLSLISSSPQPSACSDHKDLNAAQLWADKPRRFTMHIQVINFRLRGLSEGDYRSLCDQLARLSATSRA